MLIAIHRKYKHSQLSDECGGPQIYVLAAISIFFLLALYTTFAYAHKIQVMATMLHNGIKTAAITALGDHTVTDADNYGIKIVDVSDVQQEFMTNLQNNLKNWPIGSYTLQSFQVYSEGDKGSSPPSGFSQPIPGASIYITMNMNVAINPGFIPMPNTHWSIPLNIMVSSNSFESSTGAWNLVRGT